MVPSPLEGGRDTGQIDGQTTLTAHIVPHQSAGRVRSFSNVCVDVGELLMTLNYQEVPQRWIFCTISCLWTNHSALSSNCLA